MRSKIIARVAVAEYLGIELCQIFLSQFHDNQCDADHGKHFSSVDNTYTGIQSKRVDTEFLMKKLPEITLPDGIVTVHLDGERYRGAYHFRKDDLLVTAYGLRDTTTDMKILGGERGKAALNLAKLVLIDMVRDGTDVKLQDPGLSLQGSTTRCSF